MARRGTVRATFVASKGHYQAYRFSDQGGDYFPRQRFKPILGEPTPLESGGTYTVFETRDRRSIALRPLGRGDLDALVLFANSRVRKRRGTET